MNQIDEMLYRRHDGSTEDLLRMDRSGYKPNNRAYYVWRLLAILGGPWRWFQREPANEGLAFFKGLVVGLVLAAPIWVLAIWLSCK